MKSHGCLIILFALLLSTVTPIAVRADSLPPGTPPDIARIIAKGQHGQPLTMAEIKKLQQWGNDVAKKLNAPASNQSQFKPTTHGAAASSSDGVPCEIRYDVAYEMTDGAGEHLHAQASIRTRCMMYPQIAGTDDYFASALNPGASSSSFRFEPLMDGAAPKGGSGNFKKMVFDKEGRTDANGTFKNSVANFMLVTSGHGDSLYPWAGGIGGFAEGTATSRDKDGARTYKISDAMMLDALGMFAAETSRKPEAQPGKSCPIPVMVLKLSQIKAAMATGKPAIVRGSEQFNITKGALNYTGDETLTIVMHPKPLELRIEPVDVDGYKKWAPMPDAADAGTAAAKLFGDAKPISFHVLLRDPSKPGNQPSNADRSRIDVYLKEVAEQAGICMNYPASSDVKKSLFFPHDQPADFEWVDEQHVRTKSAAAFDATVNVAARDTAAYGRISARCEALGLDSTSDVDPAVPYISLPLDDNGNHVADQWEKDNELWDRDIPADWDEENTPEGWKTKGDGLVFYEEYRGFVVQKADDSEEFARLLPDRRKLFLKLDGTDRAIYRVGAEQFGRVAGVRVYYLSDPTRLQAMEGARFPRWINFNKTAVTEMQQAAVWVTGLEYDEPGTCMGMINTTAADAIPHCPRTTAYLIVNREKCGGMVDGLGHRLPPFIDMPDVGFKWKEAATSTGIAIDTMGYYVAQHKKELVDKLMVFTTMHELGHSVGGRHHGVDQYMAIDTSGMSKEQDADLKAGFFSSGSKNCPMRYWNMTQDLDERLKYMADQWDLTTAADDTPWKFCPDDTKNMRLKP